MKVAVLGCQCMRDIQTHQATENELNIGELTYHIGAGARYACKVGVVTCPTEVEAPRTSPHRCWALTFSFSESLGPQIVHQRW